MLLLILGGLGLAAMALVGGARHGGHGHAGHAGHGGHAHAGHGQAPSGPSHSHGGAHHPSIKESASRSLSALISPRILFALCLGIGTSGVFAQRWVSGTILLGVAIAGGIFFERLIVAPIWKQALRFESAPALTLESAVGSEATVASAFDKNGQGLVAIEVDGQVVQILGTLERSDRALTTRVPAGTRVRVEQVDPAKNRVTVSLI
jgi:hypothetical protein